MYVIHIFHVEYCICLGTVYILFNNIYMLYISWNYMHFLMNAFKTFDMKILHGNSESDHHHDDKQRIQKLIP